MPPKRKQQRKEDLEEVSSDAEVAETVPVKPKRGRPPKSAAQSKPEQPVEPQVKRPRGRPKGMHMHFRIPAYPFHVSAAKFQGLDNDVIRLCEKARNVF